MTPRPAANLLAVTVAVLFVAALLVPALRSGQYPDTGRLSVIPAATSSGPASGSHPSVSNGERDPGTGRSGAPETGGPRNKGRDPSSTPPLVLPPAASPALQGTGLPDSGGRGPVSRDPRRAAAVRQSAPQGARTGRTPSQAPKRVLAATARSQTASHAIRGLASWYCGSGSPCTRGYGPGPYAAAGPALRSLIPGWRGRSVTVAAAGVSVRVQLIDACGCPGGRVLDLYSWAFSQMAPLSQGVMEVTVRW